MTTACPDATSVSSRARGVLGGLTQLLGQRERLAGGPEKKRSRRALGQSSHRQDDLIRLISVNGAIRGNAAVVPLSLRDFVA